MSEHNDSNLQSEAQEAPETSTATSGAEQPSDSSRELSPAEQNRLEQIGKQMNRAELYGKDPKEIEQELLSNDATAWIPNSPEWQRKFGNDSGKTEVPDEHIDRKIEARERQRRIEGLGEEERNAFFQKAVEAKKNYPSMTEEDRTKFALEHVEGQRQQSGESETKSTGGAPNFSGNVSSATGSGENPDMIYNTDESGNAAPNLEASRKFLGVE